MHFCVHFYFLYFFLLLQDQKYTSFLIVHSAETVLYFYFSGREHEVKEQFYNLLIYCNFFPNNMTFLFDTYFITFVVHWYSKQWNKVLPSTFSLINKDSSKFLLQWWVVFFKLGFTTTNILLRLYIAIRSHPHPHPIISKDDSQAQLTVQTCAKDSTTGQCHFKCEHLYKLHW